MPGTYTFAVDIAKFCEKTRIDYLTVVRTLAFQAHRGLIMRTPVDTGRARASWRVSLNVIDESIEPIRTTKSPYKGSGGTVPPDAGELSDAQSKLAALKWGDMVYLNNSVPYIEKLESGNGSTQAPNGMLLITFEEMVRNIQDAINSIP